MSLNVGVLAYGSLINDPGEEIDQVVVDRVHPVETPFPVEFAHRSRGRDGAPTLVPVEDGGAPVQATLLVLSTDVSLEDAKDMLYRRETDSVGDENKTYPPPPSATNPVIVEVINDFEELDHVLYTRISADISDRTPENLANLAIESAVGDAGAEQRDGITYLREAIDADIETPLSEKYRQEILGRTETSDLNEAWKVVREESG